MGTNKLPQSIYLQYMPDAEALNFLIGLQDKVMQQVDCGRPVRPLQMHLTILHFGYVTDTFTQINSVNPELTELQFIIDTQKLMHYADAIMPASITVHAYKLDLYGLNKNALALTCTVEQNVRDIQEQVIQFTQEFLLNLGIHDSADMPHRRRALQVPELFNPHITLIKGHTSHSNRALPTVNPQSLQLKKFNIYC